MTKQERDYYKNMWFADYKGPEWFVNYMLDGESIYEFNGTIQGNLENAICNRINSIYWMNDAKHVAQNRVQNAINRLTTDDQCVRFIKTWVDNKFKKSLSKQFTNSENSDII